MSSCNSKPYQSYGSIPCPHCGEKFDIDTTYPNNGGVIIRVFGYIPKQQGYEDSLSQESRSWYFRPDWVSEGTDA